MPTVSYGSVVQCLGCVCQVRSTLLKGNIMSSKPANSTKTTTKSTKLSDADLEKASGGGASRVSRNSTAARQARTPKR
ncbi:MAG: hypothetical protein EBR10_01380 [Planctomycetes bacterium]|nr:hypothetical protein [Planctomycetota bacterium]